jgi:hypothetical protein
MVIRDVLRGRAQTGTDRCQPWNALMFKREQNSELNNTVSVNKAAFLSNATALNSRPEQTYLDTSGGSLRNYEFQCRNPPFNRSQRPLGVRRRSAAASLLGSRVRIPLRAWMFVSCLYVVLSCVDRVLCEELITRPEESYRVSNYMCDNRNPERGPMFQFGTYRKMNEWIPRLTLLIRSGETALSECRIFRKNKC